MISAKPTSAVTQFPRRKSAAAFDNTLLEALPVAACYVDCDGRIGAFNTHWRELMGSNPVLCDFARPQVGFLSVCKLSGARGARKLGARVLTTLHRLCKGRSTATRELSCELKAGPQRYSVRVRPLTGAAQGCLVVCEDVTLQRQTERDLQRLQVTQEIQRHSVEQYSLLAQFGQYVLGHPPYEELARQLLDTLRDGLSAVRCEMWLKAAAGQDPACVASCGRPSVGSEPGIEAHIAGNDGFHGSLRAWLRDGDATVEDCAFAHSLANTVSAYLEHKLAEDRLAYMAQFDALTGLPNRTLYLDRLAHAIDAAAREQRSVAVLFVDVDRFKAVNDTLGHAVGDELLVQIAARLKASVRSSDSIGRLSGDEFALVLSQLAHADRAAVIGRKVTAALAAPFSIQGHTVQVSGSVGISLYPADGADPETLLKNADLAMYRAKQSGRNGYQFYMPQLQEKALARLTLENRLRDALERDEFELWYQPKVYLKSGCLSGLEALLRWRTPEGTVLEPREFMPVLEDTGLILPVGQRVVAKVCAQLREWQAAGLVLPPVALNISARQFRDESVVEMLTKPILDSGIDPELIEFELTESMLMGEADAAIETMKRIKAHGVRLSLDDFGTGYSSLHYLKLFPLDSLKIDREFISDMLADGNNSRVVAAIISLARNLNLQVIAEGVETAQQLAFLKRHGCTAAQGFGLSPPLALADITQMLRQGQRWRFLGQHIRRRRA